MNIHNKSVLTLFLIVFIDLVGFGIIIPLLPFYAERFEATPAMVGIVMATYSLAQLIAAPFWGHINAMVERLLEAGTLEAQVLDRVLALPASPPHISGLASPKAS